MLLAVAVATDTGTGERVGSCIINYNYMSQSGINIRTFSFLMQGALNQ